MIHQHCGGGRSIRQQATPIPIKCRINGTEDRDTRSVVESLGEVQGSECGDERGEACRSFDDKRGCKGRK